MFHNAERRPAGYGTALEISNLSSASHSRSHAGTQGARSGAVFGHWTILAVASAHTAWARCRCGTTRLIAILDLLASLTTSCGCRPPGKIERRAHAEVVAEKRRRSDHRDWRPARGRP